MIPWSPGVPVRFIAVRGHFKKPGLSIFFEDVHETQNRRPIRTECDVFEFDEMSRIIRMSIYADVASFLKQVGASP